MKKYIIYFAGTFILVFWLNINTDMFKAFQMAFLFTILYFFIDQYPKKNAIEEKKERGD